MFSPQSVLLLKEVQGIHNVRHSSVLQFCCIQVRYGQLDGFLRIVFRYESDSCLRFFGVSIPREHIRQRRVISENIAWGFRRCSRVYSCGVLFFRYREHGSICQVPAGEKTSTTGTSPKAARIGRPLWRGLLEIETECGCRYRTYPFSHFPNFMPFLK